MLKELIILLGSPGSGKKEISKKMISYMHEKAESISWNKIARDMGASTGSLSQTDRKKLFNEMKNQVINSSKSIIILLGFGLHEDEAKEILKWIKSDEIKIGCVVEINCSLKYLIKENDTDKKAIRNDYLIWHKNKRNVKALLRRKAESYFDINGDTSKDEIVVRILSDYSVRKKCSKLYHRVAETDLNTKFGMFKLIAYQSKIDYSYHLCLVRGKVTSKSSVLCRLHSSCITGDIFHSLYCDCGQQLDLALEKISKNGSGILIYLFQEGRGINIINKIKAYQLQRNGFDTVDANLELGFADELRSYEVVADIIEDLNIDSIILMTNNPDKCDKLRDLGVPIESSIHHNIGCNSFNKEYIKTKQKRMRHDMGLSVFVGTTSDIKNAYVKNCLDDKIDVGIIIPVDVDSGVSDQPFDSEVEEGARNRARAAYESDCDNLTKKIGIGLEGGLTNINGVLHLICAASIYDGSTFFTQISEPLTLPKPVSKTIENGAEFGVEIRKYKPTKQEMGLVNELISREKSFMKVLGNAVDEYLDACKTNRVIKP